MLKMGFLINLSNLLTIASSYFVRVYITKIGGIEEVGLYSAGFAIGQPGNAEGLDDTALMWEAFYKYRVSDNITITPAIFYVSNNQAFTDATSNFGGVVQTTFRF